MGQLLDKLVKTSKLGGFYEFNTIDRSKFFLLAGTKDILNVCTVYDTSLAFNRQDNYFFDFQLKTNRESDPT